jgi:hypothetical protein
MVRGIPSASHENIHVSVLFLLGAAFLLCWLSLGIAFLFHWYCYCSVGGQNKYRLHHYRRPSPRPNESSGVDEIGLWTLDVSSR